MSLEFVTRLPSSRSDIEHWLVRADGVEQQALVIDDSGDFRRLHVFEDVEIWLGFAHPAMARVLSSTRIADGRVLVVHEDDRGPTLLEAAARIADPLDRERWVVTEIAAMCDAIAAADRRFGNFVHRDADPMQMFLAADGHVRLRAPLRIAERREGYMGAGRAVRGLVWLSPEQAKGLPLSTASDVFQLGTTIYTALSGTQPFRVGDTDFDHLFAIAKGPPPEPLRAHHLGLSQVIETAMQKPPELRHRDPAALAAALRARVEPPAAAVYAALAAWRPAPGPRLDFANEQIIGDRCRKRWDELAPTGADDVRYCGSCDQHVVRVTSLEALLPLLGNRCLHYDER